MFTSFDVRHPSAVTPLFKTSRNRFILLVLYWCLGFFLTHMPVKDGGEPVFRNFDKVAHFGLYAGLSFLIAFWLGAKQLRQQAAFTAIIICSIYGLADEGIQYFIPSRNASFWDYLADVLGAICGSLSYLFLCIVFSKDGFKSRNRKCENEE